MDTDLTNQTPAEIDAQWLPIEEHCQLAQESEALEVADLDTYEPTAREEAEVALADDHDAEVRGEGW
jgi:hypothetical protein